MRSKWEEEHFETWDETATKFSRDGFYFSFDVLAIWRWIKKWLR
jgi:hypothetical protein